MAALAKNTLAQALQSLHVPGKPAVLTNVWDAASAAAAAANPATRAIATASYAIAVSSGTSDSALTQAENLARVAQIAPTVAKANLPLTVDLQDGYADVAASVTQVIALGAVGCNLEDVDNQTGRLRSVDDAVKRIKAAKRAAADAGVPDFVINARTDVLYLQDSAQIHDAVERGRQYLAAGAGNVFVWGGPAKRELPADEVKVLVDGLQGKVNVMMSLAPGSLGVRRLSELGVARISIGPALFVKAMDGFKAGLETLLAG